MKNPLYLALIRRLGLEQRKCISSIHETLQGRAGLKGVISVMLLIYKYGLLKVRNEHTAFSGQSSLALFIPFQVQDLLV